MLLHAYYAVSFGEYHRHKINLFKQSKKMVFMVKDTDELSKVILTQHCGSSIFKMDNVTYECVDGFLIH